MATKQPLIQWTLPPGDHVVRNVCTIYLPRTLTRRAEIDLFTEFLMMIMYT